MFEFTHVSLEDGLQKKVLGCLWPSHHRSRSVENAALASRECTSFEILTAVVQGAASADKRYASAARRRGIATIASAMVGATGTPSRRGAEKGPAKDQACE
jgi:hypothetical protein